jgi:CRP/FNR family cyclic AMP-dependent transcriptional regulator
MIMSPIETKAALNAAKPFQLLQPHELDMLIAYCRVVMFAPGQSVFRQGGKSEGMYIILKGRAVVTVKILGKEAIELANVESGDFIGEVTLIEKGQCAASVTASSQLECLLITTEYFDMLALFYPDIKYKISKSIIDGVAKRLALLRERIINLMNEFRMSEKSFFGEMISSLTRPEIVSFESAHLEPKQMRGLQIFSNFSDEEYAEFIKHTELIRAVQNCTLIKEGEKDAPYYFIIRGAVQTCFTEHGKVAKIAVLGPQSMFGGVTHINNSSSNVTYITCERVILLKISMLNLAYLQKNNILLWYKIFEPISQLFVGLERSADKLLMRLNVELYNR